MSVSNGYVLVAEPEAARRKSFEALQRTLGLRVVSVADGEAARRTIVREGVPEAVVLELALPKVDGFAFLKGLRAEPATKDVPVVVVSSFRELRNQAAAMKDALGISAMFAGSSPIGAIDGTLQRLVRGRDWTASASVGAPAVPSARPRAIEVDFGANDGGEHWFDEVPSGAEAARKERWRLDRIAALGLETDLPEDSMLERLVTDTAKAFGVPVALVSLVLQEKQWFKAHVGLSGRLAADQGSPRDWAFCRHVVESNQPLVVPDAKHHPFFATNPLVLDGSVRGYAGVPLTTPDGAVMGTLCLVDTKPLEVGTDVIEALRLVARRVAGELVLRQARARENEVAAQGAFDLQFQTERSARLETRVAIGEALLAALDGAVVLFDERRRTVFVNAAFSRLFGVPVTEVLGKPRAVLADKLRARVQDPDDFDLRFAVPSDGAYAARETFFLNTPGSPAIRWTAKPLVLPGGAAFQLALFDDVTADLLLVDGIGTLTRPPPPPPAG